MMIFVPVVTNSHTNLYSKVHTFERAMFTMRNHLYFSQFNYFKSSVTLIDEFVNRVENL